MNFIINPPPRNRKCERCDKHISELKPFGGKGDPLVGDFTGVFLIKRFRPLHEGEPIEKFELILAEYELESDDKNIELEIKYGKTEIEKALLYDEAKHLISASWECRECIIS